MKLKEVKEHIDKMSVKYSGDCEVLINLSQPAIGARASVGIQYINSGFDWEQGQIRISTDKPIVLKDKDRDIPVPVIITEYPGIQKNCTRIVRHCPVCESISRKDDKYCSTCGQAITGGKR